MGYTLQQLQTMGATPIQAPSTPTAPTDNSTFPQNEPQQSHQSFMSKLGNAFKALPGQAWSDIKGGVKNVGSIASVTGQDYMQGTKDIMSNTNPSASSGLQRAGTFSKMVFAPITELINKFSTDTANAASNVKGVQDIANSPHIAAALDKVNSMSNAYNSWSQQHPEAAKNLEAALNVGQLVLGAAGEKTVTGAAEKTLNTTGDIVKTGAEKVASMNPDVRVNPTAAENVVSKANAADISKIQDTISPKLNSTETKNIINEGRLTRGKDSPIFGKQPDIVTQSKAVQEASKIINDQIPGAAKMNDAQLSNALDAKITEKATTLKPVMQATPIDKATTGKVVDAWNKLKLEQQKTPEFLDNKAGNTAFQKQFENHLQQLNWDIKNTTTNKFQTPTAKTMNDVWDVRKSYDASIPENVKNATSNSSPILQNRKTMWLDNRSLLSAAINDTANGLGDASKKPFYDMSHMYDARENIASKAKIDLTGKPGALPATKKDLMKWGLGAGATVVGGEYILKKLGL